MGNVLQKATDAKSEIDGKKAVVDENKSEFMKLKGVIAETTGAPVLGPLVCLGFHRFVGLFAFVFFLSTLSAAVPTFYEKRSFATVEFQTELTLPDIYMCLPATVMAKVTLKATSHDKEWQDCKAVPTPGNQCEFEMINGDKVAGFFDMDGSTDKDPDSTDKENPLGGATLQFRSGFGADSDASPSVPLYALDAFDLRTYARVPDPPVEELFIGGGGHHCTGKDDCPGSPSASPKANLNSWLKDTGETAAEFNKGRPLDGKVKSDEVTTTLAGLLPNISYGNSDVSALCFKHKMKSYAKSHYSNNTDVWISVSTRVAPAKHFKDTGGLFWQIYAVEQGAAPYVEIKGQKVINASYFTVPFVNTFTRVDLTPVFFKDETLGTKSMLDKTTMDFFAEEFEQSGYFSHPQRVNLGAAEADSIWAENIVAITFRHFTRRIHIRYKTFSEIWAEVGALWAGAMIFMSLFFTQSGTTDVKSKKPMMVFSPPFLAPVPVISGMISKSRKKYIQKNEAHLKAAQEMKLNTGSNASVAPDVEA
jgi:hypothetical protein